MFLIGTSSALLFIQNEKDVVVVIVVVLFLQINFLETKNNLTFIGFIHEPDSSNI